MEGNTSSKMVDWSAWNHPRRLLVALPIFFVVGHVVGFFGGVHLVSPAVPDEVVAMLFGVGAILLGGAALARID